MSTTREHSKRRWAAPQRASLLAMLGLSLSMLLLPGCPTLPTRKEVEGEVWLQSGIPAELCAKEPLLWKQGIYRKLDDGKYEFISYCTLTTVDPITPVVQNYISFNARKFNAYLDALLPEVAQ